MPAPRNYRNNNPGNLKRIAKNDIGGADPWRGLRPVQTDGTFYQFESMAYGVRAMARVVKNIPYRHGVPPTIEGIVGVYAPPVENDTAAYVEFVSVFMATPKDAELDLAWAPVLDLLLRAMMTYEGGREWLPRDKDLADGVHLALFNMTFGDEGEEA